MALQEQTTLRRYALALLRRRNRLLYELPAILCVIFGMVGAFVGISLWSLMSFRHSDFLVSGLFCDGVIVVLATSGGFLGWQVVDYYLKPYIPVAAAVLLEEARMDTGGKDSVSDDQPNQPISLIQFVHFWSPVHHSPLDRPLFSDFGPLLSLELLTRERHQLHPSPVKSS
jgi:hypothetical protein